MSTKYVRADIFSDKEKAVAFDLSRLLIRQLRPISEYLSSVVDDGDPSVSLNSDAIAMLARDNPQLFAKRYFFKNLVKCAVASVRFRREINPHRYIIDIGTGPGTFLFRSGSYLNQRRYSR